MQEARITCNCANIVIADLGLRMTKGAVAFVDEGVARKSKDLLHAARVGGVDVHFVTRAQVIRQSKEVAIGRPRRELPNLVARVSPLTPIDPAPVPVHPDLRIVDDNLSAPSAVFDDPNPIVSSNQATKTRKKKGQ